MVSDVLHFQVTIKPLCSKSLGAGEGKKKASGVVLVVFNICGMVGVHHNNQYVRHLTLNTIIYTKINIKLKFKIKVLFDSVKSPQRNGTTASSPFKRPFSKAEHQSPLGF